MTVATASLEQRAGLVAAVGGTAVAVGLMLLAARPAFWPELFLYLSFGGALLNVIGQDRSGRQVSNVDLLLVAMTAFIAIAADAPSIKDEAVRALCRVIILAGSVGALAWAYSQVRGQIGMSATDVKLIGALAIAMPLALSVYAIAFACSAAVIYAAARQLRSENGTLMADRHIPVTGIIAGMFYLAWLGYRLSL